MKLSPPSLTALSKAEPHFYARKATFQTHFKPIDMAAQQTLQSMQSHTSLSNSPESTRHLFSTGFMFKNNNSPVACDTKLSATLKKEPVTPFNPTVRNNENRRFVSPQMNPNPNPQVQMKNRYNNQTTVNYNRHDVGTIGWGLSNPKLE